VTVALWLPIGVSILLGQEFHQFKISNAFCVYLWSTNGLKYNFSVPP